MKKISILIPTYNAEKYIFMLLNSLYRQEKENFDIEIIVVDSESTDNTVEIIEGYFPEVKLYRISNKEFNHGTTRNLLAAKSQGDFLLFMTQDAIPFDNKLLCSLFSSFEDENIGVSFARHIPREDASSLEIFAREYNYPVNSEFKNQSTMKLMGIKAFFNSNVCSMYKRELFYKLDGFPENIILNEDMIFAYKAIKNGKTIHYNSNAKVLHSHNYDLNQQFKRYFDIGMAFKDTEDYFKGVSNEKEGIKMIKHQTKFLIEKRLYHYIPYALLETVYKYVGYKMGRFSIYMPITVKRKLSAYLK